MQNKMHPQQAYNAWAQQYDTNENKTRDLEAQALRDTLMQISFNRCLEIGCGTGKNTEWLLQRSQHITAVDFSEQMLVRAKAKIRSDKVNFIQADINAPWHFVRDKFDLISFSLVLEHIENLDHIFLEAARTLNPGGFIYIGELHPFKQYAGSKARFETEDGTQPVQCFTHHVSEFTSSAKKQGLDLVHINEYFDENDRAGIPRILVLLFQKS